MRRAAILFGLLISLVLAPAPLQAQGAGQTGASSDAPALIVYRRGRTIRFDPDVGADLKEVILESWSCGSASQVGRETVEAYFHLSEDGEIINPDAVCDRCLRSFDIERRGDRYFFLGVRPPPSPTAPAVPAPPPPEPLTSQDIIENLRSKLQEVAQRIAAVPPEVQGSATQRRRFITAEVTLPLHTMGDEDLGRVMDILVDTPNLDEGDQYYVLRSFGWEMYMAQEYRRSIIFYDRCIPIRPNWGSARYQRGLSFFMMQEYDRAIQSYVLALTCRAELRYATALSDCLRQVTSTPRLNATDTASLRSLAENLLLTLQEEDQERARGFVQQIESFARERYGSLE